MQTQSKAPDLPVYQLKPSTISIPGTRAFITDIINTFVEKSKCSELQGNLQLIYTDSTSPPTVVVFVSTDLKKKALKVFLMPNVSSPESTAGDKVRIRVFVESFISYSLPLLFRISYTKGLTTSLKYDDLPIERVFASLWSCNAEELQRNLQYTAKDEKGLLLDALTRLPSKVGAPRTLYKENAAPREINLAMIDMKFAPVSLYTVIAGLERNAVFNSAEFIMLILLQLCATLHLLQVRCNFCHFDLHTQNVFLGASTQGTIYTTYALAKDYDVRWINIKLPFAQGMSGMNPDDHVILQLGDFGLSYAALPWPPVAAEQALGDDDTVQYSYELRVSAGEDRYAASYPPSTLHKDSLARTNQFYPSHDLWRIALSVLHSLEVRQKALDIWKHTAKLQEDKKLRFADDYIMLYKMLNRMLTRSSAFLPVVGLLESDRQKIHAGIAYEFGVISPGHGGGFANNVLEFLTGKKLIGNNVLVSSNMMQDLWTGMQATIVAAISGTMQFDQIAIYATTYFIQHRFGGDKWDRAGDVIPFDILTDTDAATTFTGVGDIRTNRLTGSFQIGGAAVPPSKTSRVQWQIGRDGPRKYSDIQQMFDTTYGRDPVIGGVSSYTLERAQRYAALLQPKGSL